MSHSFYLVLHVFSVMLLFLAFGGAALHSAAGGTKATNPKRGLVAATHGLALVLLVVSGFGVAGKGGHFANGFPLWIMVKLGLWLVFGAAIVPLGRKAGSGGALWVVLPLLGLVAAWLGVTRPF